MAVTVILDIFRRNITIRTRPSLAPTTLVVTRVHSGWWSLLTSCRTEESKLQSTTNGTLRKQTCRHKIVRPTILPGAFTSASIGSVTNRFSISMKTLSYKVIMTVARTVVPIRLLAPRLTQWETTMPELSETLTNRPTTSVTSESPSFMVVNVWSSVKWLIIVALIEPNNRRKTSSVVRGRVKSSNPPYSALRATLTAPPRPTPTATKFLPHFAHR